MSASDAVLDAPEGLRFEAAGRHWQIDPLSVPRGAWLALVPEHDGADVDPSIDLAHMLATLRRPLQGSLQLLELDIYGLPYGQLQRLRARIGYVHGYGGLLSNRSLRDNIAMPVSVHGGLDARDEEAHVDEVLREFQLAGVAGERPHAVNGQMRWRTCVARAVALRPAWVVVEGFGNWLAARDGGVEWSRLSARRERDQTALALCLSGADAGFEGWFKQQGGVVMRYRQLTTGDGGMAK